MFGFYLDPALTTLAVELSIAADEDLAEPKFAAAVVYFGSPCKGDVLRAADAGDVMIFTDGSLDFPSNAFRLARSAFDLESAAPGAPLIIGRMLTGGHDSAVPVWIGLASRGLPSGMYRGVRLVTSEVVG